MRASRRLPAVCYVVALAGCGGASDAPALPGAAPGGPACAVAEKLHAEVPALFDQGLLDRAVQSADAADAMCPALAPRSASIRAGALALLGRARPDAKTS